MTCTRHRWYELVNDAISPQTYDLEHEIARAIEFAATLAGRPHGRPSRQDVVEAIALAFAIDDLVLVGSLHMLSQIDVYAAALREDPNGATDPTSVEPVDQLKGGDRAANDDQETAGGDRP